MKPSRQINDANFFRFIVIYTEKLREAVAKHPEVYRYTQAEVPAVVDRMREAFVRGSYNHDGLAIRNTCKAVGIKPTRTALEAFFLAPVTV